MYRLVPRRGKRLSCELSEQENGGVCAMTEAMHRILVVEDDPDIRNVLRALLESERFRFAEAATAARAEIEARAHRPDLMLVDLGLPDGDGMTVIRRVREWSPVPIMVL